MNGKKKRFSSHKGKDRSALPASLKDNFAHSHMSWEHSFIHLANIF